LSKILYDDKLNARQISDEAWVDHDYLTFCVTRGHTPFYEGE